VLIGSTLAAGVAIVPGEREQWTMLIRDSRHAEALEALDARYQAGRRDPDAVLALYRLLMSYAEIARATQVLETFVATRPNDAAAVAMLAKHHADTQNRPAEIAAFERLFALAPSPKTAQTLLSYYRLDANFDREEALLRTLLARRMIAANDVERLGLILLARSDLDDARIALTRFDEIANPERMFGRLALFELLVDTGETQTALARAAAWLPNWHKASVHRPVEVPAARLIRMMLAADEAAARKIICAAQLSGALPPLDATLLGEACPATSADAGERSRSAMRKSGARSHE
jgi:tetratricopeptide (TPR) repeat protein